MMRPLAAAAVLLVLSKVSMAAPVGVDGVFSAGEYGAPTASVGYDANNSSTFPNYSNTSNQVAYDIYLRSSDGYLYGFLNPRPDVGGQVNPGLVFANIYFDLDPAADNGSDLLFETSPTHAAAAIPGVAGSVDTPTVTAAFSTGYEFAIPLDLLTAPIAGLAYDPNQGFPTPDANPDVVLRISQSLGYTPVGGASYGVDRLGRVALQAALDVPEPASLGLVAMSLFALGSVRRRWA